VNVRFGSGEEPDRGSEGCPVNFRNVGLYDLALECVIRRRCIVAQRFARMRIPFVESWLQKPRRTQAQSQSSRASEQNYVERILPPWSFGHAYPRLNGLSYKLSTRPACC
jgi:hypothetical protein